MKFDKQDLEIWENAAPKEGMRHFFEFLMAETERVRDNKATEQTSRDEIESDLGMMRVSALALTSWFLPDPVYREIHRSLLLAFKSGHRAGARNMYEDEDAWINAIVAIGGVDMKDGSRDYDPKPLATLLRSNRPIPAGIRAQIADFLDPPEFPALNMRLEPKAIFTPRKETEAIHDIIAIGEYDSATAAGEPAEKAREHATAAVKQWADDVRELAKLTGAAAPLGAHVPSDPSAFYKRLGKVRKMLSYFSGGKNS
jgi:hypothetical protein